MSVFVDCVGPGQTWMKWFICAVFLLSWNSESADAQGCLVTIANPEEFMETAPPGLELLNISAGAGISWSFKINSHKESSELESYFRLETKANITSLILNKTLDLEEAKDIMVIDGVFVSLIQFTFTCSGDGQDVPYQIFATVLAVNEFAPELVSLPSGGFNVSESTKLNDTVLVLGDDYVVDKDVSQNHPGYDIRLLPFTNDSSMDGGRKFYVRESLTGVLSVNESLDYEAMEPSKAYYMLTVSVGDREGRTSTGTIRINVIDADDQSPEFWYPDCASPCFTAYAASVRADYQGAITWLSPAPIAARDKDSMQSSVIYNFKGGDPDDYAQYLTIDSQTGVPSVIKAVADSDAPSFFVIVEAIEDSELRHSQQTTLWIQIVGRNTTSPTRPPEQNEPYSSSTDTYRVVAIVLGVLFGLALIVLIVFVVCTMKGKMKATPVLPKTIGKLSLVKKRDAAGTESDPKSGATRERESVRSIAMRRTSGDSGVDFLRSLSNPTTSDLGGRPLSTSDTVRDPDVDQLAGTTEISLSGNSPDRRRSGVSTISASELVPYEDNAELVGSAVSPAGSGEERMGMSNPVYEAEGNTDVDVSVVPLEQAHIVI